MDMKDSICNENTGKLTDSKSDQERLVMFHSLTKSDIEKFEFVAETPAGGMAYYCNEHDFSVVVYRDRSRFFMTEMLRMVKAHHHLIRV